MSDRSKILIAEDHALFREGLRAMLSDRPDLEVIGEAPDGLAALRLTRELQPDLLLLDLSMPKLGGLDVIRELKKSEHPVKILVITAHTTDEHLWAALEAGVEGYLLKLADQAEFLVAIKSVLAGRSYLCSEVSDKVIRAAQNGQTVRPSSPLSLLTQREKSVLKLAAEGHKNKEMADLLCISIKTVEKHRTNLMRKLDLHSARELTEFARSHGLLTE